MASKEKYHGIFIISGERLEEFAYGYSEDHSLVEMALRLDAKRGMVPGVTIKYLRSHPHSYEIYLEVKSICQKSSEYMTAAQQSSCAMDAR